MRPRTAAAAVTLFLAPLTACSVGEKPAKPPASTMASPTTKAYTYEDCKGLLEYDYQQGKPQDASADPECSHLTSTQYQAAVAEVLTAHKDDFVGQDN